MRILVVEDSVKMATLLRKALSARDTPSTWPGSGQDAVGMAADNEYDVIVLDIILESGGSPLDGFAACRKIRTADCWTPVLMATARDAKLSMARSAQMASPPPPSAGLPVRRLR